MKRRPKCFTCEKQCEPPVERVDYFDIEDKTWRKVYLCVLCGDLFFHSNRKEPSRDGRRR